MIYFNYYVSLNIDMDYLDQTSRNYPIVTKDVQNKIKRTSVLLLGCGLGSKIAENLSRLGFENFTIADGDKVEISNLNRQYFFRSDIGKNKANALSKNLKKINPKIKIQIIPTYIESKKQIYDLVARNEIIINTVDPGKPLIHVDDAVHEFDKICFSPFNVVYDSLVLVFNKKSSRISKYLGNLPDNQHFLSLIHISMGGLPQNAQRLYDIYGSKILAGKIPAPQISPTASKTSALLSYLVLMHLSKNNNKINLFPKGNYI